MGSLTARVLAAIALVAVIVLLIGAALRNDGEPDVVMAADEPGEAASQPSSSEPASEASTTTEAREPIEPLPVIRPVPALIDDEQWFNTDHATLEDILDANEVVIIQFWTFSCHNCKATLPHLQALYDDFADDGLEIVGVHAPEFGFEKDPDRVVEAMSDLGVTWPVTLDQDKRSFHAWQPGRTGYWPRLFIVDGDRQIRFDHIGEGKYDEMRAAVEQLLDAA